MKKRTTKCLAFGLIAVLFTGCATAPQANTQWDYWVTEGPAGVVLPGTEMRLKQGYQIERMIATPRELREDPHLIVILKREKTRQPSSGVASDDRAIIESSEPFPEHGPLEYRPLTFELRESPHRDGPRVHPVISNRFGPVTKAGMVEPSYESQWPIRARPAPRPEHLIDTGYKIPSGVFEVEN